MIKTRSNLVQLFLLVAFPIHIWSIVLFFRDFEWIADRSSYWDAIGVGAYALAVALLESTLLFLFLVLLSLVLPKKWNEEKRLLMLVSLFYAFCWWVMVKKTHFILNETTPGYLSAFFLSTAHPYRFFMLAAGVFLFIVILSFFGPVYLIIKNDKFCRLTETINEKLVVLSGIYIFLDVIGIVIVVLRNL